MNIISKTRIEEPPTEKIHIFFHWMLLLFVVSFLGATAFFVGNAYSVESNIAATLEPTKDIRKGDQVSLVFDSPMQKESVVNGLRIEPPLEVEMHWESEKELVLKPLEYLIPETNYKIRVQNARSKWLVPQMPYTFTIQSPTAPKLVSVYPAQGQENLDYFESIKVDLDQSLGKEYTLQAKIDPLTGFDYVLDQTERKVTIVPTQQLKEDTSYTIVVELHHRFVTDFQKELYRGSFRTAKPAPPEVTYALDKNGQPTKTELSKEDVLPQITEGKYVDIDLSSQTLRIFENGRQKGAFKVSSGKRGMNTPEGTYKALLKAARPYSKEYGLYMPWFIGFTNMGHGIHELPEWPGGYKEGAAHLGTPVSHGCVRLGVGPAKIVYDFVEKGMPIVIHQ